MWIVRGVKSKKCAALDQGPDESSSAMVALNGFVVADPSIDHEDSIRGTSAVEFRKEKKR